jgi:hypothetical protein
MSLLTVVQDVCAHVGVTYPNSVFSNIASNRSMQEMLACANEQAQRIAYDHRDWTKLRAYAQLDGDGVFVPPYPVAPATEEPGIIHVWTGTTAFNLPANYKRMLLTSNVWLTTSTQQPMRFVPDTDEWLRRRINSATGSWGEWTLIGGKIHIFPVMGVGVSARFMYLDKNCIDLAGGGRGDTFLSDADTFTLDERLLKLGMIWSWKANKGAPYAEDMSTFSDALASIMGRDSPAPILVVGPTLRPTGFGTWGY